jgi:hypothetical protein
MDTEDARELLPWLLNGSLEEPERSELLAALRGDEELRRELEETRAAGEIFGQHVPAGDLVAHAFGSPAALAGERIEAHLALCERCAEEIALVRESRGLSGETDAAELRQPGVLPFRRPAAAPVRTGRMRVLALAASLAAMVGFGGWLATWQSSQGRIDDLTASLRSTLPPQAGPEAGSGALLADVLRGHRPCPGPNCLELHSTLGAVLLTVNADTEPDEVYELRLRPRGEVGEPLRFKPAAAVSAGQLEFRLPAHLIAPGDYDAELVVLTDRGWEPVESYVLTVVAGG